MIVYTKSQVSLSFCGAILALQKKNMNTQSPPSAVLFLCREILHTVNRKNKERKKRK